MLDVLLIQPPIRNYSEKHFLGISQGALTMEPNLGLCYIGAMLEKNNFKVKILDIDCNRLSFDDFLILLRKLKPRHVGIGCNTVSFNNSIKLTKIIKEFNNDIKIIFGGVHPTLFPLDVIKYDTIDFVVVGEGEYTTLELISKLINNKGNFEEIDGLIFKNRENKIIQNKERKLEKNLDNFPFPARHLIISDGTHKYFSPVARRNPITAVITHRGCPYSCIFCSKIFSEPRFRSVQNVIDEIKYIKTVEKGQDIIFRDDTFNLNKKFTIDLCKKIISNHLDINFRCICRPDLINNEILTYLKKAGCYLITYGAESGSPRILKYLKKSYNISQIKNAFKITETFKIETHALFMMGIPGETSRDILKTFSFINEIKPNYLQIMIYTPVPGNRLYNLIKTKGLLKNEIDFDKFVGFETPLLNLKNLDNVTLTRMRLSFLLRYHINPIYIKKMGNVLINRPFEFEKNLIEYLKFLRK